MRLSALACIFLALPVLADVPELTGRWSGTITTVGTRLQSSYSPITGVTLMPVPDIQVGPSPFGPLILAPDGTYSMPDLAYSGLWSVQGDSIAFTGALAGVPARIEVLDTGPVLTLDLPIGEGQHQAITFSRTAP